MDLTQLLAWIVGANTIINFGTTAYTLLSARATKALEAIKGISGKIETLSTERQQAGEAITARFQEMEKRMLKIETEMEHMPDREQVSSLAMQIEKLAGKVSVLDERISGKIETLNERLVPVHAMAHRLQELADEREK